LVPENFHFGIGKNKITLTNLNKHIDNFTKKFNNKFKLNVVDPTVYLTNNTINNLYYMANVFNYAKDDMLKVKSSQILDLKTKLQLYIPIASDNLLSFPLNDMYGSDYDGIGC
jgi:alanine-alpha-ketoisovalerate/valine-pyruvate aminotransferase